MGYMTDGLTFNVLRDANKHRLPQFKNKKGEPAHSEPDGSDWTLGEWMNAVTGEIGEAANIIKKVRRGDVDLEDVQVDLADELADAVTYLDILAFRAGINLGAAVVSKFNKISERVGSTIRMYPTGTDWYILQAEKLPLNELSSQEGIYNQEHPLNEHMKGQTVTDIASAKDGSFQFQDGRLRTSDPTTQRFLTFTHHNADAIENLAKISPVSFMNWTLGGDCHWSAIDENRWKNDLDETVIVDTNELYEIFVKYVTETQL